MNEQSFYVEWRTRASPGAAYYHGMEKVDACSTEEASEKAQCRVWRMLWGYARHHMVIDGVSTRLLVREVER